MSITLWGDVLTVLLLSFRPERTETKLAQGRANIDQWHKPLINEEIVKSHFYDFVSGNAREGVSGCSLLSKTGTAIIPEQAT